MDRRTDYTEHLVDAGSGGGLYDGQASNLYGTTPSPFEDNIDPQLRALGNQFYYPIYGQSEGSGVEDAPATTHSHAVHFEWEDRPSTLEQHQPLHQSLLQNIHRASMTPHLSSPPSQQFRQQPVANALRAGQPEYLSIQSESSTRPHSEPTQHRAFLRSGTSHAGARLPMPQTVAANHVVSEGDVNADGQPFFTPSQLSFTGSIPHDTCERPPLSAVLDPTTLLASANGSSSFNTGEAYWPYPSAPQLRYRHTHTPEDNSIAWPQEIASTNQEAENAYPSYGTSVLPQSSSPISTPARRLTFSPQAGPPTAPTRGLNSSDSRDGSASNNFACNSCEARFRTKGGLNSHKRYHKRPKHICECCSRLFHLKKDLGRHMQTHTRERPFGCAVRGCPCRYSRKDNCKRHMHVKHSVDDRNPVRLPP